MGLSSECHFIFWTHFVFNRNGRAQAGSLDEAACRSWGMSKDQACQGQVFD